MNATFTLRSAAIILMAAGYGWAGGHYIPSDSNILAYLFQFVILGVLVLFGARFFADHQLIGAKPNWAVRGLSIMAVLFFLINVLNIIHGFFNTDPNSFGSHNTFADLVPIVIILTGALLWLITIRPIRKAAV